MDKELQRRVKEIASEIASEATETGGIKFAQSGTSLVIPETLSADPGSISSGKDKGREDAPKIPKADERPKPGGDEDDDERESPDLPPDEDPDKPGKDKEGKDGDKEGKDGEKDKGKKKGDKDGGDDEGGDEEGGEGDSEGEGRKGKGKGKKKKGEKDGDGDGGDDDGGDDDGGDDDGGDDDGGDDDGPPKKRKIKKGDKVRILPTGGVGEVTDVNSDGTYKVRELDPREIVDVLGGGIFERGGQISHYEQKFLQKMDGSTERTAAYWVDGISGLSDTQKAILFERVRPHTTREAGERDMPTWVFRLPRQKPEETMADGGDVDVNVISEEVEGNVDLDDIPKTEQDYTEDELEVIGRKKDQKKTPKTPPPPPPPNQPDPIDVSAMLERLDTLRSKRFKLPALGKQMMGSDIDPNNTLYKYQMPLVLYRRYAKSVFSVKNQINDQEADSLLSFVKEFFGFVKFCHENLAYDNGAYYIDPKRKFSIVPPRGGLQGMIIQAMGLPQLSLDDIEDMLNSGDPADIMIAELALRYLEEITVRDYQYYRIVSLSAFIDPAFFGDDWIKPHLNYMFNYLRTTEVGLSNIHSVCFSSVPLEKVDSLVYESGYANLNLYNVLRETLSDKYTVHVFENIRVADRSLGIKITSYKIGTPEISSGSRITEDVCAEIIAFYQFSKTLRVGYEVREQVLKNLQKLSNLQMQSYEALLRDIDIQISNYGI